MQPAGLVVTRRCLHWFAQIIVDFSATWCGPCRLISPYFDELSAQYPGIIFLKVDVDAVDVRGLLLFGCSGAMWLGLSSRCLHSGHSSSCQRQGPS